MVNVESASASAQVIHGVVGRSEPDPEARSDYRIRITSLASLSYKARVKDCIIGTFKKKECMLGADEGSSYHHQRLQKCERASRWFNRKLF